jgi:signal transduction histidine kinase
VTSNLEVLQYGYDEEKIKNSKAELKNMTKIINGLLKFSETIQITNKIDINLENFIRKNLYFLESSDNIHITNNEFNYSILTDELLFSRVIKNLIENAVKYSIDKQVFITISD